MSLVLHQMATSYCLKYFHESAENEKNIYIQSSPGGFGQPLTLTVSVPEVDRTSTCSLLSSRDCCLTALKSVSHTPQNPWPPGPGLGLKEQEGQESSRCQNTFLSLPPVPRIQRSRLGRLLLLLTTGQKNWKICWKKSHTQRKGYKCWKSYFYLIWKVALVLSHLK